MPRNSHLLMDMTETTATTTVSLIGCTYSCLGSGWRLWIQKYLETEKSHPPVQEAKGFITEQTRQRIFLTQIHASVINQIPWVCWIHWTSVPLNTNVPLQAVSVTRNLWMNGTLPRFVDAELLFDICCYFVQHGTTTIVTVIMATDYSPRTHSVTIITLIFVTP